MEPEEKPKSQSQMVEEETRNSFNAHLEETEEEKVPEETPVVPTEEQ